MRADKLKGEKNLDGNLKAKNISKKEIKADELLFKGNISVKNEFLSENDYLPDGSLKLKSAMRLFFKLYHDDHIKKLNQNIMESGRNEVLKVDFYELNGFLKDRTNFDFTKSAKNIINAAESVLDSKITIRVTDIPSIYSLQELSSEHIGQFISAVAMVKNITPIKTKIKEARFECRGCMRLQNVTQNEYELGTVYPALCEDCGGNSFQLLEDESEFMDYRFLKLEEPIELRKSGMIREFVAYIENDLAGPNKKIKPGDVVNISGHFDTLFNKKTKERSFIIKIHNIQPLNSSFDDTELTDEDMKEIFDLAKRPDIFKKIAASIAPSVYGHEDVKEGITLQLFEGNRPEDGKSDRWVIHILLIGDPGVAKSKLIREISTKAPKVITVSGTGSSQVGLTASTIKDELMGGWTIEAGAIVLADSGLLCIDEFDKLSQDVIKSLNEPMENLTVSIAKAGMVQTMSAETSVLVAANPKYSKFDKYRNIKEQINIPESTYSRFDLVYAMEDKIDEETDKKLAEYILSNSKREDSDELLDPELIKKYITYAKNEVHPVLTTEAKEMLKDFYSKIRQPSDEDCRPTPRALKALERLSVARAKVELRECVSPQHAHEAIEIYTKSLKTLGLEPETSGILEGIKSNNEIKSIQIAENLIKSHVEENGLELPLMVVEEIKEEIKANSEVYGDDVEKIYKEAFSNIKHLIKY